VREFTVFDKSYVHAYVMKMVSVSKPRAVMVLEKRLEKEIARHQAAQASLKACKKHYAELLAGSHLAREQKLYLSRRILLAQEEERRQISRALHDEISQILAGINVRLSDLTQEASINTRSFKKKIALTQRLVEKSVSIVHRFARELRPTLLDDLGLIPALHAYMKTLTRQTGLQIRFTAYSGVEKLNNAKRTALYRVAQSALTNVAQHAKAVVVIVSLQKIPEGICLEIKDDGKSFQVERVLMAKRYRRLGLLSMRERIEMFGGTFAIESVLGKGTTLRACIPFDEAKEKGKIRHV
jgi:two-component system sensor histidine kinase DegS